MEKLLKQAQELNESLTQKIAEYKAAIAEANNTSASNRVYKDRLDALKADIEAREEAIKGTESVQEALAQVKKERAELSEAAVALEAKKEALAKQIAAHNSKAIELKRDQDLIQQGNDLLKKGREELEKEKKSYKDDILAKLKAVK